MPKASIYSIDCDWQKSRTGVSLLWHRWDLVHTRKHTLCCLWDAKRWHQMRLCCSLADFCIWFLSSANTASLNLPLNGNPFHQWLIYTHCCSPPAEASNFPNMEEVWMHKKDSTFILAGIRKCFTVLWLHWSLLALKSPVSWRGRPQIAERRNTFTHAVAPSSLHESFQLLSKFPNKNLSQWFCIGRSQAQLGAWTWWGCREASNCRLYPESWRY